MPKFNLSAKIGANCSNGSFFMFERLRRLRSDAREELDSAIGGRMIREVIEAKKQILAEETFAIRIGTAISLREIQFISQFPLDPLEKPVDIRLAKFAGHEDQGFAVFMVVKPEWLREAWNSDGQTEREYLYDRLKQTLLIIDELRKQGNKVLNDDEIQKMRRK